MDISTSAIAVCVRPLIESFYRVVEVQSMKQSEMEYSRLVRLLTPDVNHTHARAHTHTHTQAS